MFKITINASESSANVNVIEPYNSNHIVIGVEPGANISETTTQFTLTDLKTTSHLANSAKEAQASQENLTVTLESEDSADLTNHKIFLGDSVEKVGQRIPKEIIETSDNFPSIVIENRSRNGTELKLVRDNYIPNTTDNVTFKEQQSFREINLSDSQETIADLEVIFSKTTTITDSNQSIVVQQKGLEILQPLPALIERDKMDVTRIHSIEENVSNEDEESLEIESVLDRIKRLQKVSTSNSSPDLPIKKISMDEKLNVKLRNNNEQLVVNSKTFDESVIDVLGNEMTGSVAQVSSNANVCTESAQDLRMESENVDKPTSKEVIIVNSSESELSEIGPSSNKILVSDTVIKDDGNNAMDTSLGKKISRTESESTRQRSESLHDKLARMESKYLTPTAVSSPDSLQQNGFDAHHAGTQYQKFQEDPYRRPQVQQSEPPRQPVAQPVSKAEPQRATVPQAPQPPLVVSNVPPTTPAPPPVPGAPPAPPTGPPMPPGGGPPMPPGGGPPLPPGGGPPLPPGGGPPMPSGGGPPPPPPPPAVGGIGAPAAPPPPPVGGSTLAGALQGVQLKKRSEMTEERRPPPAANPMNDMMSALNKKLMARKKMADDGGESSASTPNVPKNIVPPPTVNKTSGPPAFNKPTNVVTPSNKTKTNDFVRTSSTASSSTSSDDLKALKEEIMQCVKDEINAAKKEIIDAMRQELQGLGQL